MTHRRRVTDRLPLSDIVSRGNLDDRLATVAERIQANVDLEAEKWNGHKEQHLDLARSLREYKAEANEWRQTLADLRVTFIPKAEFQSEHRALEAKLLGEIASLTTKVDTLDQRVDTNRDDTKTVATDLRTGLATINTEQSARRGVFSDGRNVLATVGLVFGLVASALLIIDRLPK